MPATPACAAPGTLAAIQPKTGIITPKRASDGIVCRMFSTDRTGPRSRRA